MTEGEPVVVYHVQYRYPGDGVWYTASYQTRLSDASDHWRQLAKIDGHAEIRVVKRTAEILLRVSPVEDMI